MSTEEEGTSALEPSPKKTKKRRRPKSAAEANPYAPPAAHVLKHAFEAAEGEGCPRCRSSDVHQPSFTWWGGFLGPKLFNHTVCRSCGFGFNARTRASNATSIWIYRGVAISIGIGAVILYRC